MNIEQMRERHASLVEQAETFRARFDELSGIDEPTDEQTGELTQVDRDLSSTLDDAEALVEQIRTFEAREHRMDEIRRISAGTVGRVESGDGAGVQVIVDRGDPYDLSSLQRDNSSAGAAERDIVERARRVIGDDDAFADEAHREEAERKVRHVRDRNARGYSVARHVLRTTAPAYRSAWLKAMSGRPELMTDEERTAVGTLEAEYRVASTTAASGGYLLPTPIDPSVIQTADVSLNPYRQVSRVVSVMNDNGWTGVSSAGITVSWDTESAEVSDDTPTFSQPNVPVYKGQGFVPFTFEIEEDWSGLAAEVAFEFAEAKNNAEGAAFATGSGSSQPTGIVTALIGTSNYTAMATNSTFASGDLFTANEAIGNRWRPNAVWMMNLVHINDVRQFGGTNFYERTVTLDQSNAGSILGKPVYESSDLSSTLDGDTNNNIVYGDFRNFVIADRIGVRTEFIPHLFATGNNRPNGQRGILMHWRVGSDSVNDAGFVLLYNPST